MREGRLMNRGPALLALTWLFLLATAQQAAAQLTFVSIDSLSSPISEDFNSIGSSPIAELPHGWRIGIAAEFALAKNSTTESAGTTGANALSSNSRGGLYNFADGENATSADLSAGFLSDLNISPQNKNLLVGLQNNSGATITDVHFSYDIEKYRSGTRANDVRLF